MRIFPVFILLAACTPKPAGNDTSVTDDSVGDDDDVGTGDDDDDVASDDDDDTAGDDDDTAGDDDDTAGDDDDTAGDDDDDVTTPNDTDGDGFMVPDDCDDTDPNIFPGADERCNGLDDDCDGSPLPDETTDVDGDGLVDCAACEDAGYWLPTRELSGSALSSEVAALVAGNTCADYGVAREFLFAQLDNNGGNIECRYTGKTRSGVGAGFNDWVDMNTEHTWPRSQGAEIEPEECDLHHLFITDAVTNSQRGSYPFGVVTNSTTTILNVSGGQSKLGTNSSGTTVFEPRDEHKGNVARAMTYFAHRYGFTLNANELSTYQAWHLSDPVDTEEIDRTFAIAAEQGAANAYVVCPNLLPEL